MKHLQELMALSAAKVHEESIPQKKLWTILLHPEDGAPGAKPYPKAQVSKLVKYLSRKGVVNVLQNDAKNLKLHVAFNDSWTEDSVWDMIQSADLDDALSWGGSVRAAKKLAEASPDKNGIMPLSYKTGKGHKIEAYGVKGMQSKQWRKSFKDEAALEKWCDDNDATVHGVADIKEGLSEGVEDMDLDELIDNWMDTKNIYHMEGPAGYRNLTKLVGILGYREVSDFLEDNSGAIESIVNWVRGQNFPEWKKGFEAYAGDSEGDEE